MPTESELIAQIESYGDWLEGELQTTMRPEFAADGDVVLLDVPSGPERDVDEIVTTSSRRSRWLMVAAAMVFATAIAAVAWPLSGTDTTEPVAEPSPTTESVSTPVGPETDDSPAAIDDVRVEALETPVPLFVLPATLDGFTREDMRLGETPNEAGEEGLFLGRPTDGGYDDVVIVRMVSDPMFAPSGDEVEVDGTRVQLPGDEADLAGTVVVVPADEGPWIEIAATDQQQALAMVPAVRSVGGELVFRPIDGFEEIGRVRQSEALRSRSILVRDQAGREALVGVVSNPESERMLFVPGRHEEVSVGGRDVLIADVPNPFDASPAMVTWMEEPGQTIVVVAADESMALEITEGLRVVDEQTWRTELESLDVFDPLESVVGVPIGTFILVDDDGERVDVVADGTPVVVVAWRNDCSLCRDALSSIRERVAAARPDARVFAVRLDDDSVPSGVDDRGGPFYSLPEPGVDLGPYDIADSLSTNTILLLDGDHKTVARIDLGGDQALELLVAELADLT